MRPQAKSHASGPTTTRNATSTVQSLTIPPLSLLLLLLLVATSVDIEAASSRKSRCPAERNLEMDECASRMIILGDHNFRVPQNSSSSAAFCARTQQAIACVQNYTRDCTQGFTKQILTGLLRRGKLQHSSVCQSEAARAEFRTRLSCLTESKINEFLRCTDASIGRYEFIKANMSAESSLAGICCSAQLYQADVEQTVTRLCGRGSTEPAKYLVKMVRGTTGEVFQLICDGHRSLDECHESEKTGAIMGKLEQVTKQIKSGERKPGAKSLLPPLLEILDASS